MNAVASQQDDVTAKSLDLFADARRNGLPGCNTGGLVSVKAANDDERRTGKRAFDARDAVLARNDGHTFSRGVHDCVAHT